MVGRCWLFFAVLYLYNVGEEVEVQGDTLEEEDGISDVDVMVGGGWRDVRGQSSMFFRCIEKKIEPQGMPGTYPAGSFDK